MNKIVKHQAILKELGLINDTREGIESKVQKVFLKKLSCLKKFSIFLTVNKGNRDTLIPKNALAEIVSSDLCNSNEYVLFNSIEIYQHFKLELSKICKKEIDISRATLEMLRDCLLYIINLLRGEQGGLNTDEIFKYFKILKKCIFTFSTENTKLVTDEFTQLVSYWISDLLKIITAADRISAKTIPKDLMTFNMVQKILSQLAHCNIYCEIIVEKILEKFECVLTYNMKPEFSAYMATQSWVFEYLLWTLKDVINRALMQKFLLNLDKLRVRKTLEALAPCLQNKLLKRFIEEILRFL